MCWNADTLPTDTHTHTQRIPSLNSVTRCLSVLSVWQAGSGVCWFCVCASKGVCVCVCAYSSPAAEKPLLLYISGFVSAVCLALLPRWQTLQASFGATLLALALFMMAVNRREGGNRRGKKETASKIPRDRQRMSDMVFISHCLFWHVFVLVFFFFFFLRNVYAQLETSNNNYDVCCLFLRSAKWEHVEEIVQSLVEMFVAVGGLTV